MIDYEYSDLFQKSNIDKQWEIEYSGGTITNEELFTESIEATESLCSESELRFGSCEAGQIKFKIANVFLPMFSKEINVQIKLMGHPDEPFQFGKYKVFSDNLTADRRWRDIVAYDAMYDILNADVAAWYNKVLPDMDSSMKMRKFRKSFLDYFGIEEADPDQELVNDDMIIQRTVEPEEMSGKDVITAICEINGCFGHINRDGKFAYIYLEQYMQGLYPANDLYPDHAPYYLPYQQDTGHLYPQNPKGVPLGEQGTYITCHYEDYITKEIKRLQIRKEENDIGVIIHEEKEGNTYIIEDNFLVYGKGTEELQKIGENIYSKIIGIIYRPFRVETQGNPCIEAGDPIRMSTQYEIVESYALERTIKGLQQLKDTFTADGVEFYSEKLNSTHNSIIELRGKSNVLSRNIEETRSDLRNTEKDLRSTISQTAGEIRSEVENTRENLQSQITQNAESITAEVSRAKGSEQELSSTLTQTATEIRGEVKNVNDTLTSTITQTASDIRSEVEKADEGLSSRIDQNATNITAEVTRAKGAEGTLSASIQVNADNIALKVSKASVISEINQSAEKITIKAAKIDLEGLVSADEFTSKYATIATLNANVASINSVVASKASVTDLNAVSARVGTIEANYISAASVAANYATITSLNAVDAKFGSINASNITSGTLSAARIDVGSLSIGASQITGTTQADAITQVHKEHIFYTTPNGDTRDITVVTQIDLHGVKVLGST